MRHTSIPLLLFAVTALAGCTVDHSRQVLANTAGDLGLHAQTRVQRQHRWRLPADTVLYVAVPAGWPADSGDAPLVLAQLSHRALAEAFVLVQVAAAPQAQAAALHAARRAGASITVWPELHGAGQGRPFWQAAGVEGADFQAPERAVQVAWRLLDTATGQPLDTLLVQHRLRVGLLPAAADDLLRPALAAAAAALVTPGRTVAVR